MARSSWNLTSFKIKIGCLSYCWANRVYRRRRKQMSILVFFLYFFFNLQQRTDCTRTKQLCALAETVLRQPTYNRRACHFPTAGQIHWSVYFDGYSTGGKTVGRPPWWWRGFSACAVFLRFIFSLLLSSNLWMKKKHIFNKFFPKHKKPDLTSEKKN